MANLEIMKKKWAKAGSTGADHEVEIWGNNHTVKCLKSLIFFGSQNICKQSILGGLLKLSIYTTSYLYGAQYHYLINFHGGPQN